MQKIEGEPGLSGINHEQRLYVIRAGSGYSCWGFDNARAAAEQAAALLNRPDLAPRCAVGTVEAFREGKAAERALCDYYRQHPSLTHFDAGTPAEVRHALEVARRDGTRVRLFLGNTETGEAWAEENDVLGTIGRSMGPMKVPLLIPNARSSGGGAILTACVVAIFNTATGAPLYVHPKFNPGAWEARGVVVYRNGEEWGREKTAERAARVAAFMAGKRFSK